MAIVTATFAEDAPPLAEYVSPEGNRILIDSGASEAGSHEVCDYLQCCRWWALNKYGSFAGKPREPFVRGGLTHTGLAHHYIQWGIKRQGWVEHEGVRYTDPRAFYSPLEAMTVLLHRLPAPEAALARSIPQDGGPTLYENSVATVAKYLDTAPYKEMFKVVGVEVPRRIDLPNGQFHTARVDLIVEEPDGIWYEDHKTTVLPLKRAIRMYTNSLQILGLHLFGQAQFGGPEYKGPRFRGVRLNVVEMGSAKSTRVVIAAPALVNDTRALLQWARSNMAMMRSVNGDNMRAYPPTGVSGSCLDSLTGSQCDAAQFCAFGDFPRVQ